MLLLSHKQQGVPGYTFVYQSPTQFKLECSRINMNLYAKITFILCCLNLSLEVSFQIGETLEVNGKFAIKS